MKQLVRPFRAFCAVFVVFATVGPSYAQTANVLSQGIWVDRAGLLSLPTSGTAWNNVFDAAQKSCGTPNLSDQEDPANVCVMAKALVFARTGQTNYRLNVVDALWSVINAGIYNGRALALGRELAAYVIAADLINLKTYDPAMDVTFRGVIRALLTTPTTDGPGNLIECNEERPNNWGMHCGASRAAVAAYLGDATQLARVAQVFKGWLGDRSSYAGFAYGDLSWQCDSTKPVGINPTGCTKSGHSIDGVLPDDQRRSGGFTWPAPQENYVYEALQGALAEAVILNRAGYDTFNWQDHALQRAFKWLLTQDNFAATGDDTWEPHIINYFYAAIGYQITAPVPTQPGKNVGWTDWTHQSAAPATPSLSLSPQTLSFSAVQGGASPPSQTVDVANVGSGTMNWTTSNSDSKWSVSPSSGSGNGTINVTPNTSGLAAGTYSANITVTSSGANGSPSTVTASVVVSASAKVGSVSMSPNTVTGGASSTGTVTLTGPAGSSGAVVTLQSNNAAASVPANVTVLSGALSATFSATTTSVSSTQAATITASYSGTATTTLTVNAATAPKVTSVSMSPSQIIGGDTSNGTVTLSAAAGSGGAVVALQSNSAIVTVPASITVAAGATSTTFTATTTSVPTTQTATITASYNGTAQTNLSVTPAGSSSLALSISPSQVTGGSSAAGKVTISTAAKGNGVTFTLQSNNSAVTVPSSVNVGHNNTTATFTITTASVSSTQTATITATGSGSTQTATLTVNPAAGGGSGGGSITPQTLAATADSYVRDGSATTNFGGDTVMEIKDGDPTFDRRGFVKFNLGGLSGNLTTATLKLYVSELPNGAPAAFCVYAVSTDSWTEGGLTWNNQPGIAGQLACANVSAVGWVSLDVTAQAKQELTGDQTFSLALEDNTAKNLMLRINTKENSSNNPGLDVR